MNETIESALEQELAAKPGHAAVVFYATRNPNNGETNHGQMDAKDYMYLCAAKRTGVGHELHTTAHGKISRTGTVCIARQGLEHCGLTLSMGAAIDEKYLDRV